MFTRIRSTRSKRIAGDTRKVSSRVLRALLACVLLVGISGNVSANESQTTWTVATMEGPKPGTYLTQEDAAAAILALPSPFPPGTPIPNPHPLLDTVKEAQIGDDGKLSIVYWMGLKPSLDPDWRYQAAGGLGPLDTEAALVAAIKARYNADYAECATQATATPVGAWYVEQPLHEDRIEQRRYSVGYIDGLGTEAVPCVARTDEFEVMRFRHQQCPNMFMQWDVEQQTCVSHITASTVTDEIFEGCEADAGEATAERGNPCNVKTGAKIEYQTDLDLGWVVFSRTYHSAVSTRAGGFGPGWSHSLDHRLSVSPNTLSLSGASGNQVRYTKVGSAYVAADNSGDRIVSSGAQWRLHRNGAVWVFDARGRLIEQQEEDGTGLVYAYERSGRLATVTHSTGRSLQFHYAGSNADAAISSVSFNGVSQASYTYTSGRQVETVTYVDGGQRRYHYEDSRFPRHLTGVTIEGNQRYSTFAYDAKGRVTSSQHAGGADGITLSYRPQGGSVVTDALGQRTEYGVTSGSGSLPRRLSEIVDEKGTVANTYQSETTDFRGRPASVTDRRGFTTTYAYAEANDPVTGAAARTETTTEAAGTPQQRVSTQRFDVASNRPILSTLGDQETRITRNARLQPVSVAVRDTITNAVRTTTFSYCEAADVAAPNSACPILGLLKTVDGPRTDVSDVTAFAYYGQDDTSCATTPALCTYRKGDLRTTTDALGRVTEVLGYSPQGRPLSVIDPNGVVTDYEYHPRGWLAATKVRGANDASEADDRITRITHEPTGLVKQVDFPDSARVVYTYDAAQRLIEAADGAGNKVRYTVDLAGNVQQEDTKTAGGIVRHTLSRVFNLRGQLEALKDASGNATTSAYDENGNLKQITDALGKATVQSFDPLNRLSQTLQHVGITPPGGSTAVTTAVTTSQGYNAFDQLLSVTDPKGLTTTYAYNGFGDQTRLTSPDTGVTELTYDAGGMLATRSDANDPVPHRYTYDALNRPTAVFHTATGPADVEYGYDTVHAECTAGQTFSVGELTTLKAEGTELRYCYDRFGQVVRKSQTVAGRTFVLSYAYTPAGHLAAVTYPDGAVVDYVRDAQARVTAIGVRPSGGVRTVLLQDIAYEPLGPAAGWTYGNGRTLSRAHDRDYRVQSLLSSGAGGLALSYGYNTLGQLSELKDANTNAPLALYRYDELGRLTRAADENDHPVERYTYDVTGNRTGVTDGGGTRQHHYGQPGNHRLTAVGAVSRGYDAVGNTTSVGAQTFVYNANDRLSEVALNGVTQVRYRYNARGERVAAGAGAGSNIDTHSVYGEAGVWIGDYDALGAPKQQVIWLDALPVGVLVGSGPAQALYHVQPDAIGTPRAVVDPARDVAVWTWDAKSEAFGHSPPNQDPDQDGTAFVFHLRFPGQRLDPITGLVYNHFRDYDPASGRYLQSDPIGLAGGLSTYAYVDGDPLRGFDPLGLRNGGGGGAAVRTWSGATSPAVNNPWAGRVAYQIQQIQTLNPTFRYTAVGPGGRGASRYDYNSLNQTWHQTQSAYQALWSNSCPSNTRISFDQLNREIARRTPGQRGREGEAAVRAVHDIGPKETFTVQNRDRQPDGINRTLKTLSEVKNTASQGLTPQIRDYISIAQANGWQFNLYTNPATHIRSSLQREINNGNVNHVRMPMPQMMTKPSPSK